MVNKCVVTNCSTCYITGQKKASFHSNEDQELKWKLIYFVNRKDLLPTNTLSVICIDYFEEKFIKRGGKNVKSCAVATTSSTYNNNDSRSNPLLLRTPTLPRKSPIKRNILLDELVLFQAADKVVATDSISGTEFTWKFRKTSPLKGLIIACYISI